jgi:phosphatidate phosphatase APP1
MKVRKRIGSLAARIDALHSRGRGTWYRRVPLDRDWTVVPYLGFGTPTGLDVSGRVLRTARYREPDAAHRSLRNFVEFWKRMESDELPGARVRACFRDVCVETVADDEGHFSTRLPLPAPLAESGWQPVDLELVDAPTRRRGAVRATAEVLVPSPSARFGVISDIDDTVLWSNVRSRLRMLAMLMRSNARTRKPFKGVAAFYRALHRGAGGHERNPLFYVSSSPWNLYGPLVDFLDIQALPRGPLLLKDFGDHLLFGGGDHRAHKRACIDRILDAFPALPFVLIGDSGEQDPEIYADVVDRRPGRVRTIYIRSVDPDPSRIEAIDRLIEVVRPTGVELVLAPDSEFAAAHAAAQGLIAVEALNEVRADKRADTKAVV